MGAPTEELITHLRPVIDTNVLVSVMLFPTASLAWISEAWRTGAIIPLVSRATVAELVRVLSYSKFRLTTDEREELLESYLRWCEAVVMPDPPPAIPDCRDPSDKPFLELALAGQADALVTGDGDLLVLAPIFPIPIITPVELKRRFDG